MLLGLGLDRSCLPEACPHVVQSTPRTREPMLVVCLWLRWVDPVGKEPDLLPFAAITDDPEPPEVAAAGHDRTIINIKPQHLNAWLNPAFYEQKLREGFRRTSSISRWAGKSPAVVCWPGSFSSGRRC